MRTVGDIWSNADPAGRRLAGPARNPAAAEDVLLRLPADAAVRALAARDPGTSAEVVDRLTRDPDPGVRAACARHPNPPAARLAELPDDEELVRHAAADPALGVEAIRAPVAALPVRRRPAGPEAPARFPGAS